MMKPALPTRSLIAATVLFLSAVLFVTVVAPAAITAPGDVGWSAQSPRFLPNLLALAIAALALQGGLRAFRQWRDSDHAKADLQDGPSPARSMPGDPRPPAALGLMLSAYTLSSLIGMAGAGIAVSIALMVLAGERNLLVLGLVGGGLSAVIAYGFTTLLNVPLPEGMLLDAIR